MKPRVGLQQPNLADEEALYEAIGLCRNKEEMKQLFHDLCTPNERQALADRWKVVEPIMSGLPYRTIYENTGVSVTTIGRVARCLSEGTGGYRLIMERSHSKK